MSRTQKSDDRRARRFIRALKGTEARQNEALELLRAFKPQDPKH